MLIVRQWQELNVIGRSSSNEIITYLELKKDSDFLKSLTR